MTLLNTVAEDTNTLTCCSWTCPYFQCFFCARCTYEESVLCWLSLDQASGSLTGRRPALNTVAGAQFLVVTWRKPLKPVNGMWAAWSPCLETILWRPLNFSSTGQFLYMEMIYVFELVWVCFNFGVIISAGNKEISWKTLENLSSVP